MDEYNKFGVIPYQELKKMVDNGIISSDILIGSRQIQPASFDLRTGLKAWKLSARFCPNQEPIKDLIKEFSEEEIDLRETHIFEPGVPYIVQVAERLDLPPGFKGVINPKSSTGRIDLFSRVFTEKATQFDSVKEGYSGPLYILLESKTFRVGIKAGIALSQIRFFYGFPLIDRSALKIRYFKEPFLFDKTNKPLPLTSDIISDGLLMTLDLEDSTKGFLAKKDVEEVLDLSKVGQHDPKKFWDIVKPENGKIILEKDHLYLLPTKEKLKIPSDCCSELAAYDPSKGEKRVHYAGFVDPGWFTFLTLEIRSHERTRMVDGEHVCKNWISKLKMPAEITYGDALKSNYHHQTGARLSKFFK